MYETELLICAAVVIGCCFIVVRAWKDVRTKTIDMEIARSRRMSQVRAARTARQEQTARANEQESIPAWIYPILERLGIEDIPDEEPPGLSAAIEKYEPLIRPFLKGFVEGGQQQQEQQVPQEQFL